MAAKAVFSCPMIALGRESIADALGRAGTMLRMNLLLPETDVAAGDGDLVSEQSFETLRPGKRAGSYIPIPNSIIRSPGNDRKMFRAFSRAAFRKFANFIFLVGLFRAWFFGSVMFVCGRLVSLN